MSDDLVDYTTEACLHWRTVYGIACTVSFIFNMLTLLTTISVTIGLNNWLGFSYILFVASILSLAVVLISALWIIFSKTVVIAGTVLTGIFMILSLVFMIPGMMLAWHFIRGISMELRIDPQQRGQPAIVVEGTTGVHWCAYYGRRGHRWLLSVLLAAGESADPLTENADGWSPLMMAVFNDNLRVVKQLLAAGADMDREDNRQGRSALHWAAIKGHSAVAKALLEAGADASKTDAMGFTAAELASQYKQTKTDKHAKTEEEINTWTTNLLNSALLTATQLRKHDEMQRMLDANASANSTDKRKSTALHWAANRGDIVGAKILIKAGADIHAKNEAGGTPLMEAAMMGKVDMVNLLLTTNASSSWEASGKGPSLYADAMLNACSGGHEKVVEALLGANEPASKAALEEAVKYNHVAVVKRLLDSMKTSNSCTRVLHAAVMVGSNVAVKYILDKKWEGVNDGQGTTALILAAQQGHLDIVLTLLDDRYKADVTKSDDGGRTALHWAASRGFVDVAKSLLKAGADTNAADDDGRTALHHAAYEGHTAVAELLLDHEADFRSTDSMGLTAAELAAKHRKDDVELIRLLSRGSSEVGVAAKEAESKMSPPMPCSSV